MDHNLSLITTVVGCLGLALILGFIAAKLKLPAIIGYLVAGILAGPATPGFVADLNISGQLAEIGVMLLMFGVGLHFSLEDLLEVKNIAIPGAIFRIILTTIISIFITNYWGWNWGEGIIFGLSLSVASTVVLLKSLETKGLLKSVNGKITVGWLIVEDITMVLVLVLLPPFSRWLGGIEKTTSANNESIYIILAITLGKVFLFILFMQLLGRKIFPWFLWQVAKTGSRELFTLCIISVAVCIAYGSTFFFGISFALGAFFGGMILQESELSFRVAEESLPLRDAFAVLFFVSVGMLFDPSIILEEPVKVLIVVFIIIIIKSIISFIFVLFYKYPLNTALTISVGLAQIGEFSFILVNLGMSLNLLSNEGRSLILAGALISISLNSLLFKLIEPLQKIVRSNSKLAQLMERDDDPLSELPLTFSSEQLTSHVVLVGYGRVGKLLANILEKSGIRIVVAEENRNVVEILRSEGKAAVCGDASEPSVIIQAHIVRASLIIIAIPDTFQVRKIIETTKLLNPKIEIIVRTHSEEEAKLLRKENVGKVFMGEHELAINMSKYILNQIDKK